MWTLLLASLALAQELSPELGPVLAEPQVVPEGYPPGLTPEALDDIAAWEKRARVLLDGPDACVDVQGTVRIHLALYSGGGWLSSGDQRDVVAQGAFQGRLDHGRWTALTTAWEPVSGPDTLTLHHFHPIVGRMAVPPDGTNDMMTLTLAGGIKFEVPEGGGESAGTLDQLLDDIHPTTTTSYTRWDADRGAVALVQAVPLSRDRGTLDVHTYFPAAGPPTTLDATFPARIKAGEGMLKVTVRDGQLHLRGKNTALGTLPGEEGVSTVVGILGFTFGFDQRVSYERARACGG